MALYKVQSPYDSAVRGMQGAAQTSAGMTRKQGEQKQEKSFGGALGSMIMGGGMGIGAADMFSGGEATKAMWGGVKGMFDSGAAAGTVGTLGEAALAPVTAATTATSMAAPVATAVGTTALPAGASFASGMGTIAGSEAALAAGGELAAGLTAGAEVAGGLSSTAPAAGAAGPVGWGLLGAGALLGLASYYL